MYEPTPKKKTTLSVTLFSGSQYLFAKAVMEEFIKPFIDSLISDPNEDPMQQYRVLKDIELLEMWEECGQDFKTNNGLRIHIGRMHGKTISQENNKRKLIDSESEGKVEILCNNCGTKFKDEFYFGCEILCIFVFSEIADDFVFFFLWVGDIFYQIMV